jgi:hypothetical protein
MRNTQTVDSERDRVFVTGVAATDYEKHPDDGLIYYHGRPIAISSPED